MALFFSAEEWKGVTVQAREATPAGGKTERKKERESERRNARRKGSSPRGPER